MAKQHKYKVTPIKRVTNALIVEIDGVVSWDGESWHIDAQVEFVSNEEMHLISVVAAQVMAIPIEEISEEDKQAIYEDAMAVFDAHSKGETL